MRERRNFVGRARTAQIILRRLCEAREPVSAARLAREDHGIPLHAARRVLTRLAARGLVKVVAADQWVAAALLRMAPPPLMLAAT